MATPFLVRFSGYRFARFPCKDGYNPHMSRLPALLSVLSDSLHAAACFVGLFRDDGSLAVSPWVVSGQSGAALALSESEILDALFGRAPPDFTVERVEAPVGDGAALRAAILIRSSDPALSPNERARWQRALATSIDAATAKKLLERAGSGSVAQRRRPPIEALYLLDESLGIALRWNAAIRPRFEDAHGALRPYIAQTLEAQLRSWRWNDPAACAPVQCSPVPEMSVTAHPLTTPEGQVRALVAISRMQVRFSAKSLRTRYRLSRRELEVLGLMLEGRRVEEVAQRLLIAESTVQYHVKNAMAKTGARNRVELAARLLGWDTGLLSASES